MAVNPVPNDADWDLLIDNLREGLCVPFLGAGASLGFGGPGLPSGRELAERIAKDCGYPGPDKQDFFRVCQYYAMQKDQASLRRLIHRSLDTSHVQPGRVHDILAKLPLRYVLTTNFDDLMERAFRANGKNPTVAVYEPRGADRPLPISSEQNPLVYKLHGCLSNPAHTLVVTEDDLIEFAVCVSKKTPSLPSEVTSIFSCCSVLFIGYGLADWNIRFLMRSIKMLDGAPSSIASFAVMRRPDDTALAQVWNSQVMYFRMKEGIRCFDCDAVEFVKELETRWQV